MNFQLDEKRLALQAAIREFAQNELLPGVIERDEASQFPLEQYKKLGELGYAGLPYPVELGGAGGDYLDYAITIEEISKVDASLGIAYSIGLSAYVGSILNGTDEQIKAWTPDVIQGKCLGSFALTEPNAGSDAGGCVTTAVKKGDKYVINGLKCFNTNGPLAEHFAVYALTQPELGAKGLSCFHVDKGTPGFSIGKIENKMGIRAAQVSELIFEECEIPETALIGKEGDGFKYAMKALDGGRIGVASQALGIAEGAFEIARKYLMTREQFGKPIYKNQHLAFKMAELECEIEMAKYMVYKAALDKSEGRPYSIPASKAKMVCTNAAMHVTTEAVQMLGGNGFMREYHVERMMRDAKITQIYEGTNEIQKLIISRDLFK
ncbi:MAG: acyl-CoA dehydrogenase family protein [Firmicutes bacterium]|nr:acyl-CoA dehydrogenase family protein [Bacillota bacterium]